MSPKSAVTGTPLANGGVPGEWTTGLCGFFEDASNCKNLNISKSKLNI